MQLLGMLTSQNFAGLTLLKPKIDPEKFPRLAVLQSNLQTAKEAGL